MLIILAAVIIIILLLLFTVLITLVLTGKDVCVPIKKIYTTHLANRSVHSCIYCTLLFTIPEAFNILQYMTT